MTERSTERDTAVGLQKGGWGTEEVRQNYDVIFCLLSRETLVDNVWELAPVWLFQLNQVKTSNSQHIAMLVVECPLRFRCELQRTTISLRSMA